MYENKIIEQETLLSTHKNHSFHNSENETFQTDYFNQGFYNSSFLNFKHDNDNLMEINLTSEDKEIKDNISYKSYNESENNNTLNIKEKDCEKVVINDTNNIIKKDKIFLCKKKSKKIINFPNFKIFKEASNKFKELIENRKKKLKNKFQLYEENSNPNLILLEYRADIDSIEIKNNIKLNKKGNDKKRKEKADDIKKKIKSRFLKTLKNNINLKLQNAGSEELLDYLPQDFVSNITKDLNKEVMKLTFRQLLERDFHSNISNPQKKKRNKGKYNKNMKVLKYLDKNIEIVKKSEFDIISNIRYKDLLKEYFMSEEFENSIHKLRKENESEEYINDYIDNAINYINFFINHKKDMNQESDNSCKNDENESL